MKSGNILSVKDGPIRSGRVCGESKMKSIRLPSATIFSYLFLQGFAGSKVPSTPPPPWRIQDFPEGAPIPEGEANLLFGIILTKNCMKINKNWSRGVRDVLDQPMHPLPWIRYCNRRFGKTNICFSFSAQVFHFLRLPFPVVQGPTHHGFPGS